MAKGRIGAFLLGAAVGAVATLFVAPRSGAETRSIVSERVGAAWNGAQDLGAQTGVQAQQVYQNVATRGQDFAQSAAARGQNFVQNAVASVQKAAGSVRTTARQAIDSDELREKIEAARQRIASQVVSNAASSSSAVDATIEVEAEGVAEAPVESAVSEEGQA